MVSAGSAQLPTIALAWRQRVAAFWLLAWPSWLISFVLLMFLTTAWTVVGLRKHAELLAWASALSFLLCQAVFVPRMLRKRFRSFRLDVLRKDGSSSATLSASEIARVWWKIILPQIVFLLAVWLLQVLLRDRLSADTARTIPTLSLWCRVLAVGPFGIYCAVPADYPGFWLKAFGQRSV